MIRGWILLSTLALGVIFKMWPDYGSAQVRFAFSERTLNTQSWVYFSMEHLIAIAYASCFLIKDRTPELLLGLFVVIMCFDMLHYLLFFRDDTVGFNLIKLILFGIPLLCFEIRHLWINLKRL